MFCTFKNIQYAKSVYLDNDRNWPGSKAKTLEAIVYCNSKTGPFKVTLKYPGLKFDCKQNIQKY